MKIPESLLASSLRCTSGKDGEAGFNAFFYDPLNRHGQSLDAAGNVVDKFTPEAHISYSSFVFLPEVFQ